jgi:hypothetical protein
MTLPFLPQWFGRHKAPDKERMEEQPDPGEAETQFLKALKFASGQGVSQDYAQAAHWYAQAAEQNHGLAQFNLATMYRQGQGVARDEAKSLMWMTRAAKLGDAAAQYKLGVQQHLACREGGPRAGPEGRIEALKWVRLSAAQGYRGAEGACEFVALGMTREEVVEGQRRVDAFVADQHA